MEFALSSGENEAYCHFGLLINNNARMRFDIGDLVSRSAADPALRQVQFARMLSATINERSDVSPAEHGAARPGEVLALMLLHEIYRHIISHYTKLDCPGIIARGLEEMRSQTEPQQVDRVLHGFVNYYPPCAAEERPAPARTYLQGVTCGTPNTERALWEMIIVHLDHENPALDVYVPLFDNSALDREIPVSEFMLQLDAWFQKQPPLPSLNLTLFETLREPMRAHPNSLEGQIEFIMRRWRALLPEKLLKQWLITRGVIAEETTFRGHGPGPAYAPFFSREDYAEPEAFTRDEDWMPKVVLIAKLAYVWLDQLSRKYGRPLTRLNDIPDEELDRLAQWGFNGLWLIGVWERSHASQNIKQRMGNTEAAASAYSLYDYVIAGELGGEAALHDLAHRCRQRGIRLAGDMVPNHTGIYSKWVIENPERFLQLNAPPFPGYQFNGPDLSDDGRVSLHIEDGYWNHSDAAVVFKRTDKWSGESTFIYHGNDGTSMPWNDTAQLNFLRPDTREAVIQTIIQVAKRFPIIRFDAAMTLAKKHYQRLWFPKPGDGGAIPSRAAFGMSKAEFDQVFPNEFWREVVDRIALEAPDTLLLAEAFWLMEGYFVRTLGMHRVYNSAFMNMLKMEENSKYRQTIKNVLEFSPEVLQRFVNFMNNPDEDTAEAQFGKGDKYFGVAVLLATMPGLPMFGHGQIEGYTEKYGMEYRRAYKDEQPDRGFIERHEREIFPLMRKRYLFSGAANFSFFDFVTPDGWVDENVFAFANHCGHEHALVIYNNAYKTTQGVIHTSTAINVGRGDEKVLRRRRLAEALDLDTDPHSYIVWRDERTKLEYLHHCRQLDEFGLHLTLNAYEFCTFISVRQICDTDHSWGKLHAKLGGMGVPSIQEAWLEMHLAGILDPFREFMTAEMLEEVLAARASGRMPEPWREKLALFLNAVNAYMGHPDGNVVSVLEHIDEDVKRLLRFLSNGAVSELPEPIQNHLASSIPSDSPTDLMIFWRVPLTYFLMRSIGCLAYSLPEPSATPAPGKSIPTDAPGPDSVEPTSSPPSLETAERTTGAWLREWLLAKPVAAAFASMDGNAWQAEQDTRLLTACMLHRRLAPGLETEVWGPVLWELFENENMHALLLMNRHADRRWINKEQLERVLLLLFLTNLITADLAVEDEKDGMIACFENIQDIMQAASDTGYDFDWLLSALR